MNWGNLQELWDEFMAFMDRTVQWLVWLFSGAEGEWPPADYPNIDDTTAA